MLESCGNMAVNTVVLCPVACVSDVIVKAGICGTGVGCVMSHPFSAFRDSLLVKSTRLVIKRLRV